MQAYHVIILITAEKLEEANGLAKQIGYDTGEDRTFGERNGCNASGLDSEPITHYFTKLAVRGQVLQNLKALEESNMNDYKIVVKPDGSEFTEEEALEALNNVKPAAPASFYEEPPTPEEE